MDKLKPPSAVPQLPVATQSLMPLTASTPPSQAEVERMRKISRMAKRLFTAYPKSDYADADAAAAGMVNVLKAYPLSVVNRLTNETESEALQLKHKFPPRLAEIKEAADALMSEHARRVAGQQRVQQQLAERAEAEKPKGDRPTITELKARYGENYGIDPYSEGQRKSVETFKAPSIEELKAYYAERPNRITELTGPSGTRTK